MRQPARFWTSAIVLWGSLSVACSPSAERAMDVGPADATTDLAVVDQHVTDVMTEPTVDGGPNAPPTGPCGCDDGDLSTEDACCDDGDPISQNFCNAICVSEDDCERCVDGDPLTTDYCSNGTCLFFDTECWNGTCADTNAVTMDRCVNEGRRVRCRHDPYPGYCVDDGHCAPRDCRTNPRCVSGRCEYDLVEQCDVRTEQIEACPSWVGAGDPCGQGADRVYMCLLDDSETCPIRLECLNERLTEIVTAACDSRCGATPEASCTPGLICDFSPNRDRTVAINPAEGTPINQVYRDGYDPPEAPLCYCGEAGMPSHCVADCPPNAPQEGTGTVRPIRTPCVYGNLICQTDSIPNNGTYPWRCQRPRLCPGTVPSGACEPSVHGECGYWGPISESDSPRTYVGVCTCEPDGEWHCTPNQSAECPLSPVTPGTSCTPSEGNRSCNYLSSSVTKRSLYCVCDGDRLWNCR